MNKDNGIGLAEAQAFLTDYYKIDSDYALQIALQVELIGEGAWSRCFGYRHGGVDLAIRFGNYVDDFETDLRAYRYATPKLPIPQVRDIGRAYAGYYTIATRVYGDPLESVDAVGWRELVPQIADALEAMRTADIANTVGFGGWGADGSGSHTSWSEHLLTVAENSDNPRGGDWQRVLAASPEGSETFAWGVELLRQSVSNSVPRCLIHADLINRNVLVDKGQIAGVFDWGCSRYGDHLYDLAWFEFWSPWYPELDMELLRAALADRWRAVGYDPHNVAGRLLTYHLHIGLDHLRYNASIGDDMNLLATAKRMRELVPHD